MSHAGLARVRLVRYQTKNKKQNKNALELPLTEGPEGPVGRATEGFIVYIPRAFPSVSSDDNLSWRTLWRFTCAFNTLRLPHHKGGAEMLTLNFVTFALMTP